MAADLGAQSACEVYVKLLQHTINEAKKVDVQLTIFWNEHPDPGRFNLDSSFKNQLQIRDVNLGNRLYTALKETWEPSHRLIVIGSDCPEIKADIIEEAFDQLNSNDVVIGPAADGGFYLLGISRWIDNLFNQISWSTSTVLSQLKSNLSEASVHELKVLRDVDTIADYRVLKSAIDNI